MFVFLCVCVCVFGPTPPKRGVICWGFAHHPHGAMHVAHTMMRTLVMMMCTVWLGGVHPVGGGSMYHTWRAYKGTKYFWLSIHFFYTTQ